MTYFRFAVRKGEANHKMHIICTAIRKQTRSNSGIITQIHDVLRLAKDELTFDRIYEAHHHDHHH